MTDVILVLDKPIELNEHYGW